MFDQKLENTNVYTKEEYFRSIRTTYFLNNKVDKIKLIEDINLCIIHLILLIKTSKNNINTTSMSYIQIN